MIWRESNLAIEAEVATDYFTLRALDAETELLSSNIDVFGKSLELTQNRRTGGIASDLDVAQAETVLRTTQAELPATQLQRAQFEHALAVLTGQAASAFTVPERPLNTPPPVIPPGLPSQLLERGRILRLPNGEWRRPTRASVWRKGHSSRPSS